MRGYEFNLLEIIEQAVGRYESPCGVMRRIAGYFELSLKTLRIPMRGYEDSKGVERTFGEAGYESPCGVMSTRASVC